MCQRKKNGKNYFKALLILIQLNVFQIKSNKRIFRTTTEISAVCRCDS